MLSTGEGKAGSFRRGWLVSGTLLAVNSALISCTTLSRLMLGNLRAACRMCRYSCGRLSSLMPHTDAWTSLLWLVLALLGLLIAPFPRLQFCRAKRRSLEVQQGEFSKHLIYSGGQAAHLSGKHASPCRYLLSTPVWEMNTHENLILSCLRWCRSKVE